jgi:hypothetical protein
MLLQLQHLLVDRVEISRRETFDASSIGIKAYYNFEGCWLMKLILEIEKIIKFEARYK